MVTLVIAYLAKPENGSGGRCHVVLEDGNLFDGSIQYCLGECEYAGDVDGARIMNAMFEMTRSQRRRVLQRSYYPTRNEI